MPWAVAAAGVTAGSGLLGGLMQSNTAANAQKQAQAQYQQQRQDLAPYREAGLAPLQAQGDLLGLNGQPAADAAMASFQSSPGYQFQLGQGLRAVDAGAAASGMLRSGATLKAEQTFGEGLANTDFTNYYNRLMGLSTLGANAAAGGAQTANQAAQTAIGGANAQSSIYGNVASSLGTAANGLFNNKDFQSWISGPSTAPGGGYVDNAPLSTV
jgi:hypothetical protein